MNLLLKMLFPINIIRVELREDGSYGENYYVYGGDGRVLVTDKIRSRGPLLIFVMGYGVICKRRGEADHVVDKVLNDTKNFMSDLSSEDRVWFVRREHIESLYVKYPDAIAIKCTPLDEDDVGEVVAKELRFGFSEKGSILCSVLARKLRLPMSLIVFVVMLVNFFVYDDLGQKVQERELLLQRLESERVKRVSFTENAAKIVDEYRYDLPHKHSFIYDRIGVIVPESIILQKVSIQPLKKAIENNRKIELVKGELIIKGRSGEVESISSFIAMLHDESFVADLRLESIDQDVDTGLFQFILRVKL